MQKYKYWRCCCQLFSLFARGLNAAAWAAVNRLNKYCRYSNIAGVGCGGTGRRKPPEKKLPFFPFLAPLTHKPCEKKQMKHTHAHTHTHTHTKTCRWMQGQDGKRVWNSSTRESSSRQASRFTKFRECHICAKATLALQSIFSTMLFLCCRLCDLRREVEEILNTRIQLKLLNLNEVDTAPHYQSSIDMHLGWKHICNFVLNYNCKNRK